MKPIIPFLLSAVLALTISCSPKEDPTTPLRILNNGAECTEATIPTAGGEIAFQVQSSLRWIVDAASTWYTVAPTSGNGNGMFKVTAQENFSVNRRETPLTILDTDGTKWTVNVSQDGLSESEYPETMNLKIMSFNILEGVKSGEKEGYEWRTSGRKERVIAMLEAEKPDILCLQECRRAQLQDLQAAFPGYTFYAYAKDGVLADNSVTDLTKGIVGDPANDASFKNGGQRNVVAFRKDIFAVEDWGVFWLSDTPYVTSKGFGTEGQKITLWLKLQIPEYKVSSYVACTHYIPQSYGNAVTPAVDVITPCGVVNVAEMKKVLGDTSAGSICPSKEIFFFMGDLNADDEATTMAPMNLWLYNARVKAPVTDNGSTYASGSQIDHIYYINATPTEFKVVSCTAAPDDATKTTYGLLSDHKPVYCNFTIKLR